MSRSLSHETVRCSYGHFYLASQFIPAAERNRCPICPEHTRIALGYLSTNLAQVALLAEAARREREECAELADLLTRAGATPRNGWAVGLGIVDAIRARGRP
jgi:hypothetical protein